MSNTVQWPGIPYEETDQGHGRVGGLCTALLAVGGCMAWTSVLYRVDEAAREVLVVALISGP